MSQHRFGDVLSRLRKKAAFPTPYAFFKGRGGRRRLGLSFQNYLNLERGKSLPQGPRLERLLDALGLEPASQGARELLSAYFADILGCDKLLQAFSFAARPDPAPGSWQLAETAARQAIGQRSRQLSLEQYALLAKDEAAYACHVVMANTRGWLEKTELARILDRRPAALEAGLRSLKAAGMMEVSGDKVRSPFAGQFVVPPAPTASAASVYSTLLKHRQRWADATGRGAFYRYLLLRAPKAGFSNYFPHMADVVGMSALYGDVEPSADSEFYLVEGKVTRIFR